MDINIAVYMLRYARSRLYGVDDIFFYFRYFDADSQASPSRRASFAAPIVVMSWVYHILFVSEYITIFISLLMR